LPALLLALLALAGILYLLRRYTLEKARMHFEVEQQRKEKERMVALDAVKTKFFTNVSHEFRTPLSLILSPLVRIIKSTHDPEQKKQIMLVQRNAKRLLNLVNQLLDFRKMEMREFKLQPTEGNIIWFIRDLVLSFGDISELKNINLSFTANVDDLVTHFDKDKMEKIVFNLLSNAFKYTHAGGSIQVSINYTVSESGVDGNFQLIVKDSGIGIPPDKQEKIFERFFQNEVPQNIANPGTGIGLAITREFVRLHNGTINVSSQPGVGTCFVVTLPVNKSGYSTLPPAETRELAIQVQQESLLTKEEGAKNGERSRQLILLAEDNDDFRFYLKDNLQHHYEVLETANGQEAWEALKTLKPDLIISDVMMPYMDGIELARRIKKCQAHATVPIVLLTAASDESLQMESYRLGVSGYLTKPFSYEVLASLIKNLLLGSKPLNGTVYKLVDVKPTEIEIKPVDEKFLEQALEVVEKQLANPEFTVEEMSRELFMHRAGLYRKILAITGTTPIEFIRKVRLKRAKQYLEKSGMTIAEIAYEVGFNNPKKFSQYFKEEFGVTPSQFQKAAK
jgi:signal transduction histidine kinase/DNA-binding response OmpR family regulator